MMKMRLLVVVLALTLLGACSDQSGTSQPDGSTTEQQLAAGSCNTDADCSEGLICQENKCVAKEIKPECVNDSECKDGKACMDGACVAKEIVAALKLAVVCPGAISTAAPAESLKTEAVVKLTFGSDRPAKFYCKVNEQTTFEECTAPKEFSEPGSYVFNVYAKDEAGVVSSIQSCTFDIRTPDVAPKIISVNPADGSIVNIGTYKISVTFSKPVVAGTGTLTLDPPRQFGTASLSPDGLTYSISYGGPNFGANLTYTITANGFKDSEGNVMDAFISHFNTVTTPINDKTIPKMPSFIMTSLTVQDQALIAWGKSEDCTNEYHDVSNCTIYPSDMTYNLYRKADDGAPEVKVNSCKGCTRFTDEIDPNKIYSYQVEGCDLANQCGPRTAWSTISVNPKVVSVVPAKDSTVNIATYKIAVTFSKPVVAGAGTLTLDPPRNYGTASLSPDGLTYSISYGGPNLGANKTYTITATGFKDAQGHTMSDFVSTFQTTTTPVEDKTIPIKPTKITALKIADGQVKLTWTQSQDCNDQYHDVSSCTYYSSDMTYNLYRGSEKIFTCKGCLEFVDGPVQSGQSYTYGVEGCDLANQCSVDKATVTITP